MATDGKGETTPVTSTIPLHRQVKSNNKNISFEIVYYIGSIKMARLGLS